MFAAALCLLMLLIAALAGLSFGSSSVSLGAFIRALIAGDTKSTAYRIMMHSRLPCVLGAMLCGSALAVAGDAPSSGHECHFPGRGHGAFPRHADQVHALPSDPAGC